MSGVATNRYTHHGRIGNRAARILLAAAGAVGCLHAAHAADVGLGITFSPEAAHMIRDWRRANGLPQPPELAQIQAPLNSGMAIAKAIHCAGLQDAMRNDLVVAASHLSSHWQVTIHVNNTPDNADFVIEVGDTVATSRGTG